MYRMSKLIGKKQIVTVGVAVSVFVGVGIAAAAEGAKWIDSAPAVTTPALTVDHVTTTLPHSEPVAVGVGEVVSDATVPATTATSPTLTLEPTIDVSTPTVEEQTSVPVTEPTAHATTVPVTEPSPPAALEPTTTAAAVPEAPAPTTTESHDAVPQGISLSCTNVGGSVSCSWSSPDMPGFARVMLLRGNGGPQGRVPFQSSDASSVSYIDPNVPAGSYSYVVVVLDGNSHTLVHSNAVLITIAAVG